MKKIYKNLVMLSVGLFLHNTSNAQCAVQNSGGSSINMFTLIRNSNSAIAANKALNTVVFIHRNDPAAFGGSSGHLKFDYSVNGGTSWTINQGNINPSLPFASRYPNIAIYNPASNTNTANAYISYMAPTFSGAATWNGEVTGVCRLNVTGITETYNQGGIGTTWQASSLVTGAPGVFWAIDPQNTGNAFNIYKGVWNTGTSDIVWSLNYSCVPTFSYMPSLTELDFNIGFDPTGNIGWFCFAGHVNPGPAPQALYPILYTTTNGGSSWTGPITVDLTKFSCITSNTVSPNNPSMNPAHDLVVDVNGNPHIITTLGNASSYVFNYTQWHHMYDITLKNGLWVAYDLGNVNGAPNTFGVSPNFATQGQAPQAARSADGTKIFATWTDNSSYSLGNVNATPNLFGKGYNVTNNSWTQTKDFTSCNTAVNGKVLFPHIAAEVLEPNASTYNIPTVYGEPTVNNDMGVVVNFKLLDNINFSTSEFSVSVPPATVTIQQAPLVVICPNSSLTINVAGNAGQALWNTGATTTTLSITSGTATSYSVVAQVGCNVGTASVAVTNLTINPSVLSIGVCPGNPANFTVTGNALGYTWTPGSVTGTNVTLNPTTSPVTLTAWGTNSCASTFTVPVNLLPQPTIVIAGSNTICAGTTLSLTANGGSTYEWNDNSTNATFTNTPQSNTGYTVTGTAVNTCTNVQTVSVTVKPSPTITVVASPTSACSGASIYMMANGAISFSYNGMASAPNVTVTPLTTTIYSVTGSSANFCETTQTINITIYDLPTLTVTPTKPIFCKGEKTKLTATGASNYTWTSVGAISPTIQVPATVTTSTTYSVVGQNSQGCVNSATFLLVVSACIGVDQVAAENLSFLIFPNPSNGNFTIKCSTKINYSISNELGQILRTGTIHQGNQYEEQISDLPAGIYFIDGTNDQGHLKQKIIVTR